ncbi:prepilin-type N-terminal cleavage/methylation domain-containing protein [bacterium]|nr:prepilin-type N-terminal cleavage/methylation domain-containing protein [bacterium]
MRAKRGFTLLELLISISILSIMMIFLYEGYAQLNKSNAVYKDELRKIQTQQIKKRVIFLDFSLALANSVKSMNQGKKEDVVFFQSTNSIHKRYNPYLAYIVKESKLYRLESSKEFKEYPLSRDTEAVVDYLGDVESFRVYKSSNENKELYLIHIDFKDEEDVLFKVKVLNEK